MSTIIYTPTTFRSKIFVLYRLLESAATTISAYQIPLPVGKQLVFHREVGCRA